MTGEDGPGRGASATLPEELPVGEAGYIEPHVEGTERRSRAPVRRERRIASLPSALAKSGFCLRNTDLETVMKQPQDYPRRILVAVTGSSPAIVTETLYVLAVRQEPPFIPTEVQLITTEVGAKRARGSPDDDKPSLLQPESGGFHRLRADYDLPPIAFEPEHIHVLKDAGDRPLGDIRSSEDNERAADTITNVVRRLTQNNDCALHVSIAGGRKTMGFYLGYALSLFGREQDRLSHVLVSEPYESIPEFFYPTPKSESIRARGPNNQPYDARDAKVTLAEIPFVRLRDGLDGLLEGKVRFSEAVTAAQRAIGPAELVIDLPARRMRAGGKVVALSPVQLAFLAWLARRRIEDREGVECPVPDVPESGHADAFLAEYRMIIGELGDDERTTKRLQEGMTHEFFSQTKSKLHRTLTRELGRRQAAPYLVSRHRLRSRWIYCLDITPSAIRFEPLEDEGNQNRRR